VVPADPSNGCGEDHERKHVTISEHIPHST